MRATAPTYRLLAVLILTAMTWAVVLPVVHVVCAMDSAMAESTCAHAASVHAHGPADEGQGHAAMGHETASVAMMPAIPAARNMACCVVESAVLEHPATPAKVTDKQAVVLSERPAIMRATTSPPVFAGFLDRAGSSPLPPLSSAELSVFLI